MQGSRPHNCLAGNDDVIAATDRGMVTVMIILDHSKTFDTLDRRFLIAILHYVGLSVDAINLLKSYLFISSIDHKLSILMVNVRDV